jgi:O-antigen/teichoic acid export membrane protein
MWVFSGRILAALAAIAGVRVLTELMDPAAYGKLALGMTGVILIQEVLFAPLGKAVLRHYVAANEQNDVQRYFRAAIVWLAKATGLTVALGVVAVLGISLSGLREWSWTAAAAVVLGILTGWDGVFSAVQSAARQRSVVAYQTTLGAALRVAMAAGLLLAFERSSEAALLGYAGAAAVVMSLRYRSLHKWVARQRSQGPVNTDWALSLWQFAWPLGIVGAFAWAQLASPRWALDVFGTRGDVGLFAVLFQLGYYPMAISASAVNQLVEPILFDRAGGGGDPTKRSSALADSRRLTVLAVAVTVVAFVLALALHDAIFRWLVAEDYRSVSHLLPWMILAAGLTSAAQVVVLSFMVDLRTRETLAVRGATSMIGIGLTIWGVYAFGVTGGVIAGVALSAIYLLWISGLSRRAHRPALRG